MVTLEDKQIEIDLKDIENTIRNKNKFDREDIQKALDKIYGKKYNPDRKKEILKNLIERTSVKIQGIQTIFNGNELENVDKTYDFLKDLDSYRGFIEEE